MPKKQAIRAKVTFSGCTVHYVNDEIDGGEDYFAKKSSLKYERRYRITFKKNTNRRT